MVLSQVFLSVVGAKGILVELEKVETSCLVGSVPFLALLTD